MIPKTIHYCWFGGGAKSEKIRKCMDSWSRHCPDYEIIEWNESNYDTNAAPRYVQQAYEAGKWAFVADYVRLDVVYSNGGVYLDTDVELIKPLDELLIFDAYFGLERSFTEVNTGLGFGAVKGLPLLDEMMGEYRNIPYTPYGGKNSEACSQKNTRVLLKHGLQIADKKTGFEWEYLCPPIRIFMPQRLLVTQSKYHRKYCIHTLVYSKLVW